VSDARLDNSRKIKAPTGTTLRAKSWLTEAPLRMLMNNLDPEVAEHPEALVVYGGIGRAARNWDAYDRIVAALETRRFIRRKRREHDRRHETLTLTAQGTAAFRDLVAEAEAYNARLMRRFSPQEAALFQRMLRDLAGDLGAP